MVTLRRQHKAQEELQSRERIEESSTKQIHRQKSLQSTLESSETTSRSSGRKGPAGAMVGVGAVAGSVGIVAVKLLAKLAGRGSTRV